MKLNARMQAQFLAIAAISLITSCGGAQSHSAMTVSSLGVEDSLSVRPFPLIQMGRWIGNAIAYGPHRDGQFPGGPPPTKAQLREDLAIILRHWHLMRVYGAVGPAEMLLELIREDGLDMKVLLGAWIAPEADEANQAELSTAIRLANSYPEIVIALCVGNETQVAWSAHRSSLSSLIEYVRQVRAATSVPVTVADDFNFWNKAESHQLAAELDFVTMHAHPLWNGQQLEDALAWTKATYAEIAAVHPGRLIALGETGWATRRHSEGEQASLMKGRMDETAQRVFFDQLRVWTTEDRIPNFFFEAFDEDWKGGNHPDEVEKHWGLYRADRSAKLAVAGKEP